MKTQEAPKKSSRKKYLKRAVTIFWLVYLSGYLALTMKGDYRGPYPNSIDHAYVDGEFVIRHQYHWQPHRTRFDRFGFNWLGAIYCPLIIVDRLVWHRDKIM